MVRWSGWINARRLGAAQRAHKPSARQVEAVPGGPPPDLARRGPFESPTQRVETSKSSWKTVLKKTTKTSDWPKSCYWGANWGRAISRSFLNVGEKRFGCNGAQVERCRCSVDSDKVKFWRSQSGHKQVVGVWGGGKGYETTQWSLLNWKVRSGES